MKKSSYRLLLAAVAMCTVPLASSAQSTVNVYGLLDLSFGSSKNPGSASSVQSVDSGKMSTSHVGFSGTESLGGGLSAVFRLESFLRADTGESARFNGDAMWSRNAFVGLEHKDYGSIKVGRSTTSLFVSTLMFNAFGDSFGYSPSIRHYYTSGTTTGDSGWSDAVAYNSPRLGAFNLGLSTALKENSNGSNMSFNLGYNQGPLAASLVVQDVKKDAAVAIADTRTVQVGASYDFGKAKAYLQWGDVDNRTTGNSYRISGLGTRIPVGAGAVLVQWGQIDAKTGADRNTVSLGYSHAMSKRTDLYGVMMRDKVDGMSTGSAYSVGLRHRF